MEPSKLNACSKCLFITMSKAKFRTKYKYTGRRRNPKLSPKPAETRLTEDKDGTEQQPQDQEDLT